MREAWHQGRRWYHVWVLDLSPAPALIDRLDAVRAALGPMVTPFSVATPHVTVWVRGFAPGPAHPAEGRVVPLRVGRVNAFASCPFLEVRAPALAAIRAGFAGPEERWSAYRPHLTVARFSGDWPVDEVRRRLRPYRALPALQVEGRLRHGVVDAWSESGEVLDPP